MEETFEIKWDNGQYIATSKEFVVSVGDPSKKKAIKMLKEVVEEHREALEEHLKKYSDKPRIQPWLDMFEEQIWPRLQAGEIKACAFVAVTEESAYPEVYYYADGPPFGVTMAVAEAAHIIRRKEGT